MQRVHSGYRLFGSTRFGAFQRLGEFESGLIVDAGAAAGSMTRLALRHAPTGSRALAFEPFPGNWPFIEKTLNGSPAKLIKAALGSREGTVNFHVGGTATAEGTWKGFDGYSSVGKIVDRPDEKTIEVPVTTVDANVNERILFLKIDVQGGEMDALRGARRTFERGIDMLYIEFGGEPDILTFLYDRDYVIFDHLYLLVPKKDADLASWKIESTSTLSTGHVAHFGWPHTTPGDPDEYCEMLHRESRRVGSVYTDIVPVRRGLAEARGWLLA